MKTVNAAILGIVMVLMAVQASASQGRHVDVEVVSDSGNVFQLIPHKEYNTGSTYVLKQYLEARKGENYNILIRNHLSERIGVVIAVDGRNIITGKKSSLNSSEMMYIVEPYGHARLEGWRTSDEKVNRFYFTSSADSYSVRTFSDTSAMGIIAVAVFREKQRPAVLHEQERSLGKAQGAPAAPSAPRSEAKRTAKDEAGTGFGSEHYSPVVKVEFEPENIPVEKFLLKYEWRDELCRKGIIQCRPEVKNRLWDSDEYAPYPPGYHQR
ncbi:MAG: hypothetical protein HZA15_03895 [Nitrospirae bacterium]|nr:hypothetical protein [Nitrospirota bacterium]